MSQPSQKGNRNPYNNTTHCRTCARDISSNLFRQHCLGNRHLKLLPNKITIKGPVGNIDAESVGNYLKQYGLFAEEEPVETNGELLLSYTFEEKIACYEVIRKDKIEIEGVGSDVVLTWQSNIPIQQVHICAPAIQADNSSVKKTEAEAPNPAKMMKVNTEDPEAVKKAVLSIIAKSIDFNEQVHLLQSNLQANYRQLEEKRNIVHQDIKEALTPAFRFHQIYFFGSSVTGLDFQGSDLDVYIGNVRKFTEPQVVTLKKIRFQIYRSKKFCDVLLISNAKVPIIKCIHTTTQLCCDLNIMNMLAVNNSELINYYLSLDSKLRPLMVLIKYWTECCGLKKVNCFSGYALCMMTIFYLQQEPYNLPAVVALQNQAPTNIQDDWNCGFAPMQNFSSPNLQHTTILDLFTGFAEYYSNFDYISDVICPFLGRIVKRTDFLNFAGLPECYKRYKQVAAASASNLLNVNAAISIQDPFELNRNVTASATLHTVGKFAIVCKSALELASQGGDDFLKELLVTCPTVNLNEISFDLFKTENFNDDSSVNWFDLVKEIVLKTLRDVLAYQVNELSSLPQIKYPYDDVDDLGSIERVNYECLGKYNVWERRCHALQAIQEKLPATLSQIDREVAITEQLLKMAQNLSASKISVALFFHRDLQQVTVVTQATTKFKNFPYISHFLEVKLQNWLKMAEIGTNSPPTRTTGGVQEVMDEAAIENDKSVEKLPETVADSAQTQQQTTDTIDEAAKDKADEQTVEPQAEPRSVEQIALDQQAEAGETLKESAVNGQLTTEEHSELNKEQKLLGSAVKTNDEGDDDIPANFFDELLDKDFMDGLDVVDAWETHEPAPQAKEEAPKKEKEPDSSAATKSETPKSEPKKSSKSRERVRRDPQKTLRDINRDKQIKTQDKKQKSVTDRLSLVETGLVVPGTEMDMDFETVSTIQSAQVEDDSWEKERARERELLKRERVREREREQQQQREREQQQRERLEKRRERIRSPTPERKRSSHRYSRSPLRHEKEIVLTRHRRMRSRSVSDRERWIRGKRPHDESPPRSKRKKHEEKTKKKSFLEEISEKLNEISRPAVSPQTYTVPVPAPVPAPVYYPVPRQPLPPPMHPPQYDQTFFIGDTYLNSNPAMQQQQPPPPPIMYPNVEQSLVTQSKSGKLNVVQVPQAVIKPVSIQKNAGDLIGSDANAKEDIDRLFADKKISLSDFLAITAKSEVQSAKPENLQKKIKVISRCQDVVKLMSHDGNFTGRLIVKPSGKRQVNNDSAKKKQYDSPLKRLSVVTFPFTKPEPIKEGDTFSVALDKVMQKIGLITETITLDDFYPDVDTRETRVKSTTPIWRNPSNPSIKECEECRCRKAKKYSEVGSQATKDTCTVGVQVNEDELVKPGKDLQKNDSLAHLTPAQLMAKSKESPIKKQQQPAAAATERRSFPANRPGNVRQGNFNDPFMFGHDSQMRSAQRPLFSARSGHLGPSRGMSPFFNQHQAFRGGRNPSQSPYGPRF